MTRTLAPTSEAEAAGIIRAAAASRNPLRLIGNGTRAGMGRPVQAAETISTRALTGITLYEPAEMVIGARAGTPLAEIEAALSEKGQMLPFEPMDHRALYGTSGAPTIGAIAAGNLSGPRRLWAGACRDSLIGVRFINGAGEALSSGGRVMKNVTGLDLVKLHAGAWGTLGLLTEVIFKVVPKPETTRTLLLSGLDDAKAIATMTAAITSPFEITGAAHLPAKESAAARTALRIEGFLPSVTYRAGRLQELLKAYGGFETLEGDEQAQFWAGIRDGVPLAQPAEAAIWQLSVKPTEGATVLATIRAARDAEGYFDWGGGLLRVATSAEGDAGAAIIRKAAKAASGYATLVRAPEAIRAAVPVFEPEVPAIAALSSRIRASIDPHRLFNPGLMHAEM